MPPRPSPFNEPHLRNVMGTHRDWKFRRAFQHWSIITVAIVITAAALMGEASDVDVAMNAALLSLVLLVSTAFELVGLHFCQDTSELLCGVWIAGSPFVLGYAYTGQLRYWHFASGALLVLLATFNLCKDCERVRRNRPG